MITFAFAVLFILATILSVQFYRKLKALKARYSHYDTLSSVDDEVTRLTCEKVKLSEELSKFAVLYEKVKSEIALFSEQADLVTYGFYTPKYDFSDSKLFKERLEEVRDKQKALIQDQNAIICTTQWTVEGSKAKGRAMTNHIIKLALNAFNVQCDNTILKVSFSNIKASEERLHKIRDNIDKLLSDNKCNVTPQFFKLKLEELYLAYEYEEKVEAEKEEQRLMREQIKEEEKARREMEKAKEDAERDEKAYQKAIEKARKDLGAKSDQERSVLEAKIAELESKLKEVQDKQRAISQAELTKTGHVYIISNIGSFGEQVFKIGMTRRLEPLERVKELSDASVPFEFDVHAMIRTENAPDLERRLHQHFNNRRVNRVNERKEFFSVTLDEIEMKCREFGVNCEFVSLAAAKEYRQTQALLASKPTPEKQADSGDDLLSQIKAIKDKVA